jgi:Asp-tRNA(Asn)/Glu-tRNA(Gln) amidotransferase A subunit family amidase
MSELLADARLGEIARGLRTGDREPGSYHATVRDRFAIAEPVVRAFVDPPDIERVDAEMADMADRFSGHKPPLYGVPVGVKDIFHADGFETRAGSSVPPAALRGPEATVVTALREAGAIVLGKTVTAEFAYFAPGPTRNPHDPAHTPGGSSSGSAAAVAAGLCPLALGTQTIGSVNRPASFCGVVGVKPSYGRIPIDGVLPAAPSVDTVGYFTQDVAGARLAAGVLYDEWRAGGASRRLETVGVVDGPSLDGASPEGRRQFEAIVDQLAESGLDVRRVECVPDVEAVNERHERLVAAEMALSHSELSPEYGDRYEPATRGLIEEGQQVDVGTLCEARAGRGRLRRAIHDRMDDGDLDVVVSPSAPGAAPEGIGSTGDPVMNLPWTHAGLPAVTVPAARTDEGLPIGLQCVGRFGADERVLPWAGELRSVLSGDS